MIFFDGQLDLFGTFSGSSVTKSLIYSSIHYTPSYLARAIVENTLKALNLEEFSMDRAIFRIFTGISNAFVAFSISVAAGALLLLLSI